METIKYYEEQDSILQIERQAIVDEIARNDKEAAELLEKDCNLTAEQLKNGERQAIREKRSELANRIEDLETAKEKVEKDLEELKVCRQLAELQPRVPKYYESVEAYHEAYSAMIHKIRLYSELSKEMPSIINTFLEMPHPLDQLLAIKRYVSDLGFCPASFLKGEVVEKGQGQADISEELDQFDMKIDELPDFTKITRALNDLQERLAFNARSYTDRFAEKDKNSKLLKSGTMGGQISRVVRRDVIPDIDRNPYR